MEDYTLKELTPKARKLLLTTRYLGNPEAYRVSTGGASSLFSSPALATVKTAGVIWATDSYDGHKESFGSSITTAKAVHIVPRSEKAKAEQKKRTKDKAEVFTPSWVCNLQNNLVDDEVLYPAAFNIADASAKTWIPSAEPIRFEEPHGWLTYVTSKRLEITCGEAPYLVSRYDTVTGLPIPVRDAEGRYARIGLLDRKLRVVSENAPEGETAAETRETWVYLALEALKATFGYEWQGDNLLLARLNVLNTFVDYHVDRFGETPDDALLETVAEIVSWQLWQMDGLKMVQPLSCSDKCSGCDKKNKRRTGHDGKVALVRWGSTVKTFEELLPFGS